MGDVARIAADVEELKDVQQAQGRELALVNHWWKGDGVLGAEDRLRDQEKKTAGLEREAVRHSVCKVRRQEIEGQIKHIKATYATKQEVESSTKELLKAIKDRGSTFKWTVDVIVRLAPWGGVLYMFFEYFANKGGTP